MKTVFDYMFQSGAAGAAAVSSAPAAGSEESWVAKAVNGYVAWRRDRETLRQLNALSNAQLKDIGLTRDDVELAEDASDLSKRTR